MNPADLTLNISPSLSSKALPVSSLSQRNGRIPIPRVDLEPIYTQLKAALGDGWADYKAAVNAFVLGSCPYFQKKGETYEECWLIVSFAIQAA